MEEDFEILEYTSTETHRDILDRWPFTEWGYVNGTKDTFPHEEHGKVFSSRVAAKRGGEWLFCRVWETSEGERKIIIQLNPPVEANSLGEAIYQCRVRLACQLVDSCQEMIDNAMENGIADEVYEESKKGYLRELEQLEAERTGWN